MCEKGSERIIKSVRKLSLRLPKIFLLLKLAEIKIENWPLPAAVLFYNHCSLMKSARLAQLGHCFLFSFAFVLFPASRVIFKFLRKVGTILGLSQETKVDINMLI